MKFTYIGPHDAVDLPGVGTVAHGEQVDVTGAAAKSLQQQDTWKRCDTPPARPKPRSEKES